MTENQRKNRSAERPECSAQSVGDFCRKLIASMNMDLTLEVKEEPGLIFVNLTGPDRPFLLSNSASLLNSMEFLLNKAFRRVNDDSSGMEFLLNKAFRRVNDDSSGITLDSDSYRQHREMELVLLAQMASKKVLSLPERKN